MPRQLPKSRVTSIPLRVSKRRLPIAPPTFDALALWATISGATAVALAAFVLFGVGDATGATFILVATAILIGVALYGSATPLDKDSSKPD